MPIFFDEMRSFGGKASDAILTISSYCVTKSSSNQFAPNPPSPCVHS